MTRGGVIHNFRDGFTALCDSARLAGMETRRHVMHVNDVQLPVDRPLTVDDLERLPDGGNRYELNYGVLEVTPAPGGAHEDALHRLEFLLELCRPPKFRVMRGQGVNLHGDPTFKRPHVEGD